MAIFSRVADLVSSNVHAWLDKIEDPEAMIAHIIREMEEGLGEARHHAAIALASERRLARELDRHRAEAERLKAKARAALTADREDLARRALVRKKEHDELVRALEMQHEAALQVGESVRTSLRALESRLVEARFKQRALLARHRAAQARQRIDQTVAAGFPNIGTPLARFDRLEHRLLDFEDELEAQAEVNRVLGGVDIELADVDRGIDAELETLKRETAADHPR